MGSLALALLSEPLLLVTAVVLLAYVSIKYMQCRKGRLPPGPAGLPLIGNLLSVDRQFYFRDCIHWAKKYGPVIRIKKGATNIIVLTDQTSIEKYLCKKEVLNRPSQWTAHNRTNGFGSINGDHWHENRRVCMKILADLGFGKESMHSHLQEEAHHLVKKLNALGGKPVIARELLSASVLNNILFYLVGTRYDLDDPKLERMARLVVAFSGVGLEFSLEDLPAWLKWLSQRLSLKRDSSAISSNIKEFTDYMSKEISNYRNIPGSQRNECFVESFLREIENREDGDECITASRLVGNVCDLMVAATATTTTVLHCHMLQLASEPEGLQSQLQHEIAAVVGRERLPTWEDRVCMPLTMATIWEMYRCRPPTPIGIPRGVAEDAHFGNHFIPKHSVILSNLWMAHRNSDRWKKPNEFNPRRFLKHDGCAQLTRPSGVLAFSVGKRMCPGESMANAEVFLYITSLLQRFRILLEEGRSLDIHKTGVPAKEIAGLKLRFLPR
ncbi:cytochrome P450 2J4-like [Dermacentor silvarum]|uniref:cytochrome P450 2J4-like n=1 Tax=Dermacentor silvarum TaxID=543639 RepID=UPI002100C2AD|nr:cytochrome P450 2J4-like [Dermacentor silvarum]